MRSRSLPALLMAVSVVMVGPVLVQPVWAQVGAADAQAATAKPTKTRPTASAAAARRAALTKARKARLRWSAPLEFGIYPGGGAGAVNGRGEPRPEVAELRLSALQALRKPGSPFAVHLYDAYTGPRDVAATPAWLRDQITDYTAAGIRVELVLRYRPTAKTGDVSGFTAFVRSRVRELGPNVNVTSLQITNEANVTVAPDAADGAYPGAMKALVKGVVAAKQEVVRGGYGQLAIGFNWADESGPRAVQFFRTLRRSGGPSFRRSVDWVGVDAYPGTWGPKLGNGDLASAVGAATRSTLRSLRKVHLPAAGLPRAPIVIAESGYPTDAVARTEAEQSKVLTAAVETIVATRKQYGVVGYRWFDLRDADSGVASFEGHYGLMNDDYSPKPAFDVYRGLVSRHG